MNRLTLVFQCPETLSCSNPPKPLSCLSSLQTDHSHLPQSILLLKGMLSRSTRLKKVKFACSCYVLSVPLSISGIKCLLLGVRFCMCLAPNCQQNPVIWALSLPWLVPPLDLFPTHWLVSAAYLMLSELAPKKWLIKNTHYHQVNYKGGVGFLKWAFSKHLGTLRVKEQATFGHKYFSLIKNFSQRKDPFPRHK